MVNEIRMSHTNAIVRVSPLRLSYGHALNFKSHFLALVFYLLPNQASFFWPNLEPVRAYQRSEDHFEKPHLIWIFDIIIGSANCSVAIAFFGALYGDVRCCPYWECVFAPWLAMRRCANMSRASRNYKVWRMRGWYRADTGPRAAHSSRGKLK